MQAYVEKMFLSRHNRALKNISYYAKKRRHLCRLCYYAAASGKEESFNQSPYVSACSCSSMDLNVNLNMNMNIKMNKTNTN
jgi:hypothetical protein